MRDDRTYECLLRVKNVRIGEKKGDVNHNDEFTTAMHKLSNTKIVAKKIYPSWFESKNYFLHADWVEVIQKIV